MMINSRKRFEKWAEGKLNIAQSSFMKAAGRYDDGLTMVAWMAWQAAKADKPSRESDNG